ncbi:MAG: hypothetical protein U9N11_00400 [Campylobacterota bacterium]|nr:hypothetical protein [Campylobacterota bacterium]
MRLEDKPLNFVVNFLLGASWASVFLGAITSFLLFYNDSIAYAIVSGAIGAIPGMVAILLIDHFITNKEKLHELKKQTKLIEKSLLER